MAYEKASSSSSQDLSNFSPLRYFTLSLTSIMLFTIPPLVALAAYASAAPTGSTATASHSSTASSASSAAAASPTVAYASDDMNYSFWNKFADTTPEAVRGTTGGSILGPQNVPLERQGPDFLAPPTTDSGSV